MTTNNSSRNSLPGAVSDISNSLAQLGKWLSLSSAPKHSVDIPKNFIGINVAPSDDPAVDAYILDRLVELGLSQVRMGFTYDSINGSAQRLLNRLLDNGIEVMLVVFPPFTQAQQLHKSDAGQQQWANFLEELFQCYQHRVNCFEIGATPNRGKWSGFSSRSLLCAWEIAISISKSYDVCLAGPNVSDFEPLFNATYLAQIQRFGAAPTIHTDNLFVERVMEPEAYDHRVFGRFAAPRLKLNLIKKARILQRIGSDGGSSETWCTYTCWTKKRLARQAAWPEDKCADYLTRYLVLAATSGALTRVFWGPLICWRDGLISTAENDYPAIDQVAFYQRTRGRLENFSITPVFYALKYAIARLAGARCIDNHHDVEGASLFRFVDSREQYFDLVWCRDGQSWPLLAYYSEEALQKASFYDSQGQSIGRPAVLCEHPLFIEFEKNQPPMAFKQIAGELPSNIIHLSSPTHQSIAYHNKQWVGAYMLRRDQQRHDLSDANALNPEAIVKMEELAVLRDTRNRIWNVADPRGIAQYVTVKLNRARGFKRISYRFRPSKGRRHWNNACEMTRRSVKTPLPVAFHERPRQSGIKNSYYLCEFVADAFSVRDVYGALANKDQPFRGLDKSAWYELLSGFVCRMHNNQIVHKDLSAGNLLLQQMSDGTIQPMLIDIGRAWLGNGSALKDRHRMIDLIRIAYKLNWNERDQFVAAYEVHLGRSLSFLWRIPFYYYDTKQGLKKRLKGKYRKKRAH